MPTGNVEIVRQVKAELEAQGVNLSGACGAFRITHEVARRLAPTYYLLRKGGGNRAIPQPDGTCQTEGGPGYATDYIIHRDTFYGYDILGDGGGANSPQWGTPETAADMVARNRANFAEPMMNWPPAATEPDDENEAEEADATLLETLTALALQLQAIPPALEAQAKLLKTIADTVTEIRELQDKGLTGRLAYTLTLKPPTEKKANGQG